MSPLPPALTLPSTRSAWLAEAAATLRLGWPLVLTNLAQTAMTATDVMMMGQLGPDALAAGADVVLTGRVADPSLFAAPLIHTVRNAGYLFTPEVEAAT